LLELNFQQIRAYSQGQREAFEELCCQIFRRSPEVPDGAIYRRFRGAGGDGGVEAIWRCANGSAWGLQSKFFQSLGNGEKEQMRRSVQQATESYPHLSRYTFTLPIQLTGRGAGGKGKRGQTERLESWAEEWRIAAAARGASLEIDWWDATELGDRLLEMDSSGGRVRYWFDAEILSQDWFAKHLSDATAQAGARYSPQLSVDVPAFDALEAFGRTDRWLRSVREETSKLEIAGHAWCRRINGKPRSGELWPEGITVQARQLAQTVAEIREHLRLLTDVGGGDEDPNIETIKSLLKAAIALAGICEAKLKDQLEAKHGENFDTPGFRQFMAEYMSAFPAGSLDAARNLATILRQIEQFLEGPGGALPHAGLMLLHGPAGVGKTHAIVDHAHSRHERGFRNIIVYGEDFGAEEPWLTLVKKLGFGRDVGRDELFETLDAAAEASGKPLVLYIDALNETIPDRRRWASWLAPLAEQISRSGYLKLCVSCRDTYLREVAPRWEQVPNFYHNGFAGREFEAITRFFQHYGLEAPAAPLLEPEFANPLFLHLVCQGVQAEGLRTLPTGGQGLSAIIRLFLGAKNKRIAQAIDYDEREQRVPEAVKTLAGAMAKRRPAPLPLEDAKECVEALYPSVRQSASLFDQLERESLITAFPGERLLLGEPAYFVHFTFERIGDHLLADHYLEGLHTAETRGRFQLPSSLDFAFQNDEAAAAHRGLLEALAIQLPELFDIELDEVAPNLDLHGSVIPCVLASLPWRAADATTERTEALVIRALHHADTAKLAFETLCSLAARSSHPLNARFLDHLFRGTPIVVRDPRWALALHDSFEARGNAWRLVDWSLRAELTGIGDEAARLWSMALAWFCAAPDRRVRDRATKGLVRLCQAFPKLPAFLIQRFSAIDDDYVLERVLVAAYGALLLLRDDKALAAAAEEAWEIVEDEEGPSLNAYIRDHARLILEYAVERHVAPERAQPSRFRPPYSSPWPLRLPTEEEVKPYEEDRERFPHSMVLEQQVGYASGTDFARYVVETRLINSFDIDAAGLDRAGVLRWFLSQAVELGYPGPHNMCAHYDYLMISKYGAGRSRSRWAERLGKKYYWIFLHRLVGQVADQVPRHKFWVEDVHPTDLQALDLRDIDPTDLRAWQDRAGSEQVQRDWYINVGYTFHTGAELSDAEWVLQDDLPDVRSALTVQDPKACEPWVPLSLVANWRSQLPQDAEERYPYRLVNLVVESHVTSVDNMPKLRRELKAKRFRSDRLGSDVRDYRGYLGEYPAGLAYRQRFLSGEISFEDNIGGAPLSRVLLRQLRGAEWEYDCSQEGGAEGLRVPAPALIEHGNLRWNGSSGWVDQSNNLQVLDPQTADPPPSALLVRNTFLDDYLEQNKLALVWCILQAKDVITGGGDFRGRRERWSAYSLRGGKIRRLGLEEEVIPARA
jgi:hypothetical protein